MVMAASATLNTQGNQRPLKSRKSATAPKRMRSMTLPSAPPITSPSATAVSRRVAPLSHHKNTPEITNESTTRPQRARSLLGAQQAEADAPVPDHLQVENRRDSMKPQP